MNPKMVSRKKRIKTPEPSVSGNGVTIQFQKQGIYYVKVQDDAIFTMDFFSLSLKFRKNHPQNDPKLLLFEFGKYATVDVETREFSSQRENSPFIAEAVVVTNLAQRLLVKHYAKIMNERGVLVQLFNDCTLAKSWLVSVQNTI